MRGKQISLEDCEEYRDFVEKFKPKKTTDDCYTPANIYEAVLRYVKEKITDDFDKVWRPFYPGVDYEEEMEQYGPRDVVIDNPPFSILSEIVANYKHDGVRFFLFCPHLTCLNYQGVCKVITDSGIVYENGAEVATAFITNLLPYEVITAPLLAQWIEQANRQNRQQKPKVLSKYQRPPEVVMVTDMAKLCRNGHRMILPRERAAFIRKMGNGTQLYGGGLLVPPGSWVKGEREKEPEVSEEEEAPKYLALSGREREIIKLLEGGGKRGTGD